jgi:SAM-dependent methyltransferase
MTIKQLLPWWARMGAKIVMSRLPVGYGVWKRLGLFVHGDMDQPKRAMDTFLMHANTAGVMPIADKPDFAILELGPGDSVFTALIAKSLGASRSWLVDAGPFATRDIQAYKTMAEYLRTQGLDFSWPGVNEFNALLAACSSTYLTSGVASLAEIPDSSIDFCFSNAVLEHIPKADFSRLAFELNRVLKPEGVCVHCVDLKDHLGGGLNNLRFSAATWESRLFRSSGFYTNRIRFAEMLALFEQSGFSCNVPRKVIWDCLPIDRNKLAIEFRSLPDEELCVSGFDVVLRKQLAC